MKGIPGAALLLCLTTAAASAYELQPPVAHAMAGWADAVAIGDVDGDGRDDVVVATADYGEEDANKLFVYLQRQDGTLADPVKVPYPGGNDIGLAIANLDGGASKEVIVGDSAGVTLLKWNKLERLRRMQTYAGLTTQAVNVIAVLDVDRDGHPDIIGQTYTAGATIFLGNGTGGIRKKLLLPTPVQGWNDLKSGDLNGDGHADVAVVSGTGNRLAYVYYNDGTEDLGSQVEINPNPGVHLNAAIGVGDFNSDGRNDLAVVKDRSQISLFNQDPNGTLIPASVLATGAYPEAMVGSDMDSDGGVDLVVAHGGGGLGILFQGSGGLQTETAYPWLDQTHINPQGLAVGDINGDGCKDVVIANYNYGLVVYLGSGCVTKPDLVPSLGLTRNFVSLRVDNAGSAAANDTHAALMLSVSSGSLALGELPAGCSLVSQSTRAAQLDCSYGSMAAGASDTRTLSFQVTGGDLRNAVVAKAGVATSSLESRTNNNGASKRVMLGF